MTESHARIAEKDGDRAETQPLHTVGVDAIGNAQAQIEAVPQTPEVPAIGIDTGNQAMAAVKIPRPQDLVAHPGLPMGC